MTAPTLADVRAAVTNGGGLPEQIDRVVVIDTVVVIDRDPPASVVLVHRHGAPDLVGWWRDDRLTLWEGAA